MRIAQSPEAGSRCRHAMSSAVFLSSLRSPESV